MRVFRFARIALLALLVCLIPASSFAGVFISVAVAPPVLPVYEQPPCPEAGWMWTPGYWAYDYNAQDYYWVPGTWVPAPYMGALWTPGYWGWGGGLYAWHPGYWGPHVGYYGGVNYGFGYMGIGFAGGLWVGGAFRYNTAVMHVNTTVIHNTYIDNTVVRNTTIVNDRHVAFSGGPGGINHPPTAQETAYTHEQHQAPTSFQAQHEGAARTSPNSFASHNGGHPANVAMARPMGANHQMIGSQSSGSGAGKINADRGLNAPNHNNNNQPQDRGLSAPTHNNNQPQDRGLSAPHNNQPQDRGLSAPTHNNNQPQDRGLSAPHNNQPQERGLSAPHNNPPAPRAGEQQHGGGEHEKGH